MCCYDEMGIDPDGTASKRTVGLAKPKRGKKQTRKKTKKEEALWRQQVQLTNKEGNNAIFHVTVGLFCWRDQAHSTKPFIVHASEKLRLVGGE